MARSFNAPFVAEMEKRSPEGPAPRNLIEFGFATPVTYADQGIIDFDDTATPTVVDNTIDPTGLAANSNTKDVYCSEQNGDIYKQTAGEGNFIALSQTVRAWGGMAVNSTTGDVYVVVIGGDIYKQTAGEGNFIALSQTSRSWRDIAVNSTTGDVYATVFNGGIYKQTAGVGNFISTGATLRTWYGIAINSTTGDVYAGVVLPGDIYKQTAGAGAFVGVGTTSRFWTGIAINSTTGDVYACASGSGIYKRTAGVGAFASLGHPASSYNCITGDGDLYSGVDNVAIYRYLIAIDGLVKSWDFVDTNLGYTNRSSIVNIPSVPEFQVTIINSEDPRFTDNITTADPIEGIEVVLYQYFIGIGLSDKEILFKGTVVRSEYDEFECRLTLKGVWTNYNRIIGDDLLITEADYPSCDPDDVGVMQNIVYGSVQQVPCQVIDAGGIDNLASTITAIQTTLPLVDATKFRTAGNGKLGVEPISWTGKSGETLTGVTRGAGAAASVAGTVVFEVLTSFVYSIASHPVKTLEDIYVDGFLIDRVATKYTGKSGEELAGYSGLAVVSVPGLVSRANASLLLQDNGVGSTIATAAVAKVEGSADLTISDVIALFNALGQTEDEGAHDHAGTEQIITWKFDNVSVESNAIDGKYLFDSDFSTGGQISTSAGYIRIAKAFLEQHPGDPTEIRAALHLRSDHGGALMSFTPLTGSIAAAAGVTAGTTYKGAWTAVNSVTDTWAKIQALVGNLRYISGTIANNWTAECWLEVKYTPASGSAAATGVDFSLLYTAGVTAGVDKNTIGEKGGTVSRSGVTNLSGNSVATVEVGIELTADLSGRIDDDSLETLIELPNAVIEDILLNYCSFPPGDIGASFATSGDFFDDSSRNYTFGFVLTSPTRAERLLGRLAIQCRSRFYVTPYGTAELVVRQLAQASGNAIGSSEIKINSMKIYRSNEVDIINSFNVKYDQDWRLKDANSFKKTEVFSDATSISRYGIKEPSDESVFEFFAVNSTTMITDVIAYWLALLKDSRTRPSFSVFLDNLDIEAGDYLAVTHSLDDMVSFVVEVISIRYILGSATNNVLDRVELTTLEN